MFVHELILNLEYDFEIIFEEKTKEFKKKWQELILYYKWAVPTIAIWLSIYKS